MYQTIQYLKELHHFDKSDNTSYVTIVHYARHIIKTIFKSELHIIRIVIVNLESGITNIHVLYSAYINKFKLVILVPAFISEQTVQARYIRTRAYTFSWKYANNSNSKILLYIYIYIYIVVNRGLLRIMSMFLAMDVPLLL